MATVAVAAAGGAALVCAMASRAGGSDGRAWGLLSAGALAWGAGIAMFIASGGSSPGGETLALLIGWGAILALASVHLPGAPPHASGQGRTAVDGLIVAGSALFVGWMLGIGDLYAKAGDHRGLLLGVAVGGVALAGAAVVMLTRGRAAARGRLAPAAAGLSLLALGTCGLAYLALGGSFEAAAVLYAAWPAGWLLVSLAAWRGRDASSLEELEPGLPTRASVFIPSVPFAISVLAAASAGARGGLQGFLVWNGAAVIVLIVMRQVLALWENISFWRSLEAKVEARTDDLRRSETRFRSLVQNSSDVIAVIAADGTVRYLSPSARSVFGLEPAEVEGKNSRDRIVEEDFMRVGAATWKLQSKPGVTDAIEFRIKRDDGRVRDVEAIVTNLLHDEAVEGFVVNARDITERKQLERQLTHRAFHDPLTELANRALFGDRLEHALSRRARDPDTLAVLFMDLDDFKNVNDSLGHDAGDDLLAAVARRLLACSRPPDTVARLGGDEFAILLEDIDGALGAARVAERALAAFEEPLRIGERELFVSASVGIATNSAASESAEELLRNADVAMYTAKARGKARFEHFEHRMHAALVERLELEHDLRDALDGEQFVLHYQPVVSLQSGSVRAVEALVRWDHPERGHLAPGEFIELAEQTGLIVPIGRRVLDAACRQMAAWRDELQGAGRLAMMVNLSAKQLQDPQLVQDVQSALERYEVDPGDLLLELTESVIVEDEGTIERMKEIRGLGVRIGIDDFGTKYSSLSYLRRLPIDVLKIDQEFMEGVGRGSPEAALVQAILAMCHSMGLTPIAEGVETPEQEKELKRMGCDLAQGYLFAKPAPPREVGELIADSAISSLLDSPRKP